MFLAKTSRVCLRKPRQMHATARKIFRNKQLPPHRDSRRSRGSFECRWTEGTHVSQSIHFDSLQKLEPTKVYFRSVYFGGYGTMWARKDEQKVHTCANADFKFDQKGVLSLLSVIPGLCSPCWSTLRKTGPRRVQLFPDSGLSKFILPVLILVRRDVKAYLPTGARAGGRAGDGAGEYGKVD